ncbi:MAG: hypothetical protein M0P71_15435 [Melioribacteraceae bacterium]|nr:hypothetical protein [Melioribacteraceae bacterium]
MILKDGVRMNGVSHELIIAFIIVNEVFRYFDYQFVVTSVTDSKHSNKSLHYSGNAFDLRTRHIKDSKMIDSIVNVIKQRLGKHYDVILETDHIHIEYQPNF